MSKKEEKWEPPKDWSIYEHSWVRIPIHDWSKGKNGVRYAYAYIDKIKSAEYQGGYNVDFYSLTLEGRSIDINGFVKGLQFDKDNLCFGLISDHEPLQFCTEEEALAEMTEAAKKLVKFYLEQECLENQSIN